MNPDEPFQVNKPKELTHQDVRRIVREEIRGKDCAGTGTTIMVGLMFIVFVINGCSFAIK